MSWKKAWPAGLREKLKKEFGLSDKDVAAIEAYGSVEEFRKDPKNVLKAAKKEEMLKTLKTAGLW